MGLNGLLEAASDVASQIRPIDRFCVFLVLSKVIQIVGAVEQGKETKLTMRAMSHMHVRHAAHTHMRTRMGTDIETDTEGERCQISCCTTCHLCMHDVHNPTAGLESTRKRVHAG